MKKENFNQKDIGIVLICNRNPEIHKRIPTKNIFCSNFQDIVVKYPVFCDYIYGFILYWDIFMCAVHL